MSDGVGNTTNRIEIQPDPSALATSVAGELLSKLASVQSGGRVAVIGLTGGSIADAVHAELARLSPGAAVDWSRVEVWWGDERYVAADSPDRNAVQARRALLDHVPVDAARVHQMPAGGEGAVPVDEAATAYGEEIRAQGSGEFDVLMLGVGPDGHIASLFPGFPQLDVEDRVAVGVTESPKPPPERISLTYGALNRSAEVWFLVAGEGKAEAVAAALSGADRHQIPATGVTGREETIWWLDQAAASRL